MPDTAPALRPARVLLQPPRPADGPALITLNRASAAFHQPWVAPPITAAAYATYLERSTRPDSACRLIWRCADSKLLGAVNLSQIFYGSFESAYMGYYIGAPFAGQGYMREAVALLLEEAFGPLGLHRVEANIQPNNRASRALIQRLGFTHEGFSRRYLKIDGEWRDHERWAMLAEDWANQALKER